MHIISGIVGVAIGFLLIRYSVTLTETFGRMDWAEQYLRGGLAGTYSMYRLVGLIFIILSLLYMFNAAGFILGPVSNLFGGAKSSSQ